MSGKGDKQRPTDSKKYSENWDRIFKKKQDDDKSIKSIQPR